MLFKVPTDMFRVFRMYAYQINAYGAYDISPLITVKIEGEAYSNIYYHH